MPTSNAIRILYMEDDAGLARLFKKSWNEPAFPSTSLPTAKPV